MSRNRRTSEDYALEKEIKDSLKVSSYADQIFDAIVNKRDVQSGYVPDYGDGGGRQGQSGQNESNSLFPMTLDYMANAAMEGLKQEGMVSAIQNVPSLSKYATTHAETSSQSTQPHHVISQRQYAALQKYPSLIEFLGTHEGEVIAREIAAKVNAGMVGRIEKNSQAANKYAQSCVADRQNIKQYFMDENRNWVCCVTASGPFRGDEAIYYHKKLDKATVLRPRGEQYEDVSGQFNIIHEYAEK